MTRHRLWLLAVLFAAWQVVTASEPPRHERRTPIVEAFEKCKDAVVSISSKYVVAQRNDFFSLTPDGWPFMAPRRRTVTLTSLGSGFVLDSRGYVITNAHVVEQAAEVTVVMSDGSQYQAEKTAVDEARDLAVLKIEADKPLPTVELGTSGDLMIGETVLAIGNPFGYQHTLTDGIISAIHRDVELSEQRTLVDLIQISAPINPGSSGGPLLNINGELIGLNTAIRRAAQGIGFAIPADQLRKHLPTMLDIEKLRRIDFGARIGVSPCPPGSTEPPSSAEDTMGRPCGLGVLAVRPDSAAAKAGLQKGDVIVAADGEPVNSAIDFQLDMLQRRLDSTVRLLVLRGEDTKQLAITLHQRPKPDGQALAYEMFGMRLDVLTAQLARRYRLGVQVGSLFVREMAEGSPAQAAGIEAGDILLAAGNAKIDDLDQLGLELELTPVGTGVQMTFSGVRSVSFGFRERVAYTTVVQVRPDQKVPAQTGRRFDL